MSERLDRQPNSAQRLAIAVSALVRLARWPSPANPVLTFILATLIVAGLGAVPQIRFMIKIGSGGTAPYSKIQAQVMFFVLHPFLERMSRDTPVWHMFALIAGCWLVAGMVVAAVVTVVARRMGLSALGVIIGTAVVVQSLFVILRDLSPLVLPY